VGVVCLAYTNFTVEAGKTYRIRVINSGTKNELIFAIDSHTFTVIEVDGQYVKPTVGDSIRVNLGQRYSLLVTANQTVDNYWMRAVFPIGGNQVDIISDGLASFRYEGAPIDEYPTTQPTYVNEVVVDALKPLYPSVALPADVIHTLNLTSDLQEKHFFINNITFTAPAVPVYFNMLQNNNDYQTHVITLRANQVVRLVINNFNLVEHPIHLHVRYSYLSILFSASNFVFRVCF
jgi:iron transport multicopper oxidase